MGDIKMRKVKVLVLITAMDRGGAETMVMNYLRNIDREKVQMDFLVIRKYKSDYEDEIKQMGSNVYHLNPIFLKNIGRFKREFRKFLTEHREYMIIHSHLEERSYFPMKIAKKMGVPVRIVHAHSIPNDKGPKQWARLYMRNRLKGLYTHGFACSEKTAKWLFGNNTKNITIMNNAIDTEKFKANEKTGKKLRQQLKIDEKTLVVGHIGRFVKQKNQQFLIDIFRNVNNQRPNRKLLLIGGGKPKVEQKYKNEVMKKIKEQGLENKVKFLGVRDNIEELLQVMDVLVMPSTSEGFPVTLVEAQAAGVRCIASDRIDYKVNITDEIQYEALESDAVDWANRIISFTNTELDAEEMNRKVKIAGFDVKEKAKDLEEFYIGVSKSI